MAVDIDAIIVVLDEARNGLNVARNAAEQWRTGGIAGVTHTTGQEAALRTAFTDGIQAGKDGIAAVETELAN